MAARIGIWTIRLMREDGLNDDTDTKKWDEENQEVHDTAADLMGLVEQTISNRLPEGFYAKVED